MITVKDRQSLPDIAVTAAGSMEALMALAVANDISVSDDLADGQELREVAVEDRNVVQSFSVSGEEPATAIEVTEGGIVYDGIGWMTVEVDFIVHSA